MVLVVLEICYRSYIFDFYKSNLELLNKEELADPADKKVLLAMGDSFTADQDSYVKYLRQALPNYKVINSGIPGTTVDQAALMAGRRIKELNPSIFIYQIYLGNDLFEFRHAQEGDVSLTRKVYWLLADRFLILQYINARLPMLRQSLLKDLPTQKNIKLLEQYSIETYSPRVKMQIRAENSFAENSIYLKGGREKDMQKYLVKLNALLNEVPDTCAKYIVVIPHCSLVNKKYQMQYEELGMKFSDQFENGPQAYPFLTELQENLKNEKVKILELSSILNATDSIQNVFYENDPHLNAFGQNRVGEYIKENLN